MFMGLLEVVRLLRFSSLSKLFPKYLSICYNNLFECIDFADEWAGFRFEGAWTE